MESRYTEKTTKRMCQIKVSYALNLQYAQADSTCMEEVYCYQLPFGKN